jgi:hypothetical protein
MVAADDQVGSAQIHGLQKTLQESFYFLDLLSRYCGVLGMTRQISQKILKKSKIQCVRNASQSTAGLARRKQWERFSMTHQERVSEIVMESTALQYIRYTPEPLPIGQCSDGGCASEFAYSRDGQDGAKRVDITHAEPSLG